MTKSRYYPIFINGGGGGKDPVLTPLQVTPTRETQTFYPDADSDGFSEVGVGGYVPNNTPISVVPSTTTVVFATPIGYDGIENVTVEGVTSDIDTNIKPENIKKDVEILGVVGTMESGGDNQFDLFITKELVHASSDAVLTNGKSLFQNHTKLQTADLVIGAPASDNAFYNMFVGCTALTQAPIFTATTLRNFCCQQMFYGCTALTQAPDLPATTLGGGCYDNMFTNCTSLTQAPSVLPATSLGNECYSNMFNGCTALTQAPTLPATSVSPGCYKYMFNGCTALTQAPDLPATTLDGSCYDSMFRGCTALTQAPDLPATTLTVYCYQNMFVSCTELTQAPDLPATTLQYYCYYNMFNGCSSLQKTGIIAAQGNISTNAANMFANCRSLREMTWTATTPPTINANMWQGCPSDMVIYVPDESVDAYKAASVWSTRAAYIKPMSERPIDSIRLTNSLDGISYDIDGGERVFIPNLGESTVQKIQIPTGSTQITFHDEEPNKSKVIDVDESGIETRVDGYVLDISTYNNSIISIYDRN